MKFKVYTKRLLNPRRPSISKMLTTAFTFTLLIVGSTSVSQIEYDTRAKILVKQAGGGDQIIYTGRPLYEDLLKKSSVIMDKTGALKRYIVDTKLLLVTAPPKWGKTTNVDMLRFALESENFSRNKPKDKVVTGHQFKDRMRGVAFEFFKRGTIYDKYYKKLHKYEQAPTIASANDLLNRYCGKFPVIFVNFSNANWTGNDFKTMISEFKIVLSETFKTHEYAARKLERTLNGRSLTPNQQKIFRRNIVTLDRFMNAAEDSPVELQCSLQFLSITLRNHYLKYVHILIDDYDLVFRKYFLENNCSLEEATKIENFFTQFYKQTFKSNPFLEKAFVTGVLNLKVAEDFSLVNGHFHQYFGFTKNEISRLFYVLNITYDLGQNARKWYGGYNTFEMLEPTVYNPWSIAHFSNSKQVVNYMKNATDTSFFKQMLRNHNISSMFESLLYNNKFPVLKENLQYDVNVFFKLKNVLSGQLDDDMKDHERYVLNYMLALGYLTIDMNYEGIKTLKPLSFVNVKVPNLEVYEQLKDLVMNSYTDGWNDTARDALQQVSAELSKFVGDTEEDANTTSLADSLSQLFRLMVNNEEDDEADFGTRTQEDPNLVHRIMFMAAFYARIIGKYELEGKTIFRQVAPADKFRPDIRFIQGARATVIEVTNGANCTVPAFSNMNSSLKFHERFLKNRMVPITTVRWVDVRIYPNASVNIDVKQTARNVTL